MANPDDKDIPQMVNHCTAFHDRYYVFLFYIHEK